MHSWIIIDSCLNTDKCLHNYDILLLWHLRQFFLFLKMIILDGNYQLFTKNNSSDSEHLL